MGTYEYVLQQPRILATNTSDFLSQPALYKISAKCGLALYILTQTSLTKKDATHLCAEDAENGFLQFEEPGPFK